MVISPQHSQSFDGEFAAAGSSDETNNDEPVAGTSAPSVDSSPLSVSSYDSHEVRSLTFESSTQDMDAPVAAPTKKPLNLIGNQSSFLPGTKPKAVVPALQQAAKLKEVEAAKALQKEADRKKKELEQKERKAVPSVQGQTTKPASQPVVFAAGSKLPVGLNPILKSSQAKPVQRPPLLPNAVVSATASQKAMVPVAPAPKPKVGLFGILKKAFTSTPSKAPAPKEEEIVVETDNNENTKPVPPSPLATSASTFVKSPQADASQITQHVASPANVLQVRERSSQQTIERNCPSP